jgi:hypothetical protein
MAAVLVLAGCSGGVPGGDDGSTGATGSVTFYVSDQPGAIEDFEHLNATITEVAVKPATDGTDGEEDDGNDTEWQRYDVDERTVDLTALRGDNATTLDTYDLPAGEYEAVSLSVSKIDGTLTGGESANVKLPSDSLKLQTPFTVESGESLEYVFDVMVVKSGQSGMYVLRPVISESGTDVPIREVGPNGQPVDRRGGGPDVADDTATQAGGEDGDEPADAPPAQMDFYVSDQQNAIDDFEHLNVTITEIGLERADAEGDAADEEADQAETNETDSDDTEGERSDATEEEQDDSKAERTGWETYEVDNVTVDLTTLQGANATRIADLAVNSGNYTTVFVHVSEVEGTLTDGTETTVKLPSERLKLNKPFELAPNASVDFVYDVTVRKAGKSGKYVLQPVVGESGPDVEIREVDRQGRPVEDRGDRSDASNDRDAGDRNERATDRDGGSDEVGESDDTATPTPAD